MNGNDILSLQPIENLVPKGKMIISENAKALFDQYRVGQLTAQAIHEVSSAIEQTLQSAIPGHYSPHDAIADQLLAHPTIPEHDKDWCTDFTAFMLAVTCAIPSENTSTNLSCYSEFIVLGYTREIRAHIRNLASMGVSNIPRLLERIESHRVKLALSLLEVSGENAIKESIALDNLSMLEKVLAHYDEEHPWDRVCRQLAHFPLAPNTAIHKACLAKGKSNAEIALAKITLMREQLNINEPFGCTYHRNLDRRSPTLFPRNQATWATACHGTIDPFYTCKPFYALLDQHPYEAVNAFFPPSAVMAILSEKEFKWADTLTHAFLDAGVPADFIISHGVCAIAKGQPSASLRRCLTYLGMMAPVHQRFYTTVYQDYLKDFETKTLVDNCESDASLKALYEVTQDRAVLRLAKGSVRDAVFGSDLGL